jgi:hypothetical protein
MKSFKKFKEPVNETNISTSEKQTSEYKVAKEAFGALLNGSLNSNQSLKNFITITMKEMKVSNYDYEKVLGFIRKLGYTGKMNEDNL